jgi:hypothetical protein
LLYRVRCSTEITIEGSIMLIRGGSLGGTRGSITAYA